MGRCRSSGDGTIVAPQSSGSIYARRNRRAALTLEVRYDKSSAIALYEGSGFRQYGEHAHYYADGAAALRYEKSLDPASGRETGNNPPSDGVRPLRGASRPR